MPKYLIKTIMERKGYCEGEVEVKINSSDYFARYEYEATEIVDHGDWENPPSTELRDSHTEITEVYKDEELINIKDIPNEVNDILLDYCTEDAETKDLIYD